MKMEITLTEDEFSEMIEKALIEKAKVDDSYKMIESREYSRCFIFSNEKKEVEDNGEENGK